MYRVLVALAVLAACAPVAAFVGRGRPLVMPVARGTQGPVRLTPLALGTADFKNGLTIEYESTPYKILEFLHVKPGKGSAFVRTKLKNLLTGNSVEKTFRAGESVGAAQVEKQNLQFTYEEGEQYAFMDTETFETIMIDQKVIGKASDYMAEGSDVLVQWWNGKVIDVELPGTLELKVVDTDPGIKGDTAKGGGNKPAKLETGATIMVPLFVDIGDTIQVDTREDRYIKRV